MKFTLFVFCLCLYKEGSLVRSMRLPDLDDITPEEYPFHAVVHGTKLCGGILIAENYVITPASCVHGYSRSSDVTVYLGYHHKPNHHNHDDKHSEPKTEVHNCAEIFIHDDFAKAKNHHYLNNIALIKLSEPAKLNENIQPGKLISQKEAQLLEGSYVNVTGWLEDREDMKISPAYIRDQDTCSFIFDNDFFRSQELCVKWLSSYPLDLLGDVVTISNKIVGFQSSAAQCANTKLGCSEQDVVLNFAPYQNWMSHVMDIPLEQFTVSSDDDVLTSVVQSSYSLSQEAPKAPNCCKDYDAEISALNDTIGTVIVQIQNIRTEQQSFALSLNEQIANIRTEITNNRIRIEQNELKLQEELNGVRTEVANGISAQKSLSDLEAQLRALDDNVQYNITAKLTVLEQQLLHLINVTEVRYVEQNQLLVLHQEGIDDLNEKYTTLDAREFEHHGFLTKEIENVKAIIKQVPAENDLQQQLIEIKAHLEHEGKTIKKLEVDLHHLSDAFAMKSIVNYHEFEKIEEGFSEQKNELEKHKINDTRELNALWYELKTLNHTVFKIHDHIHDH